MITALPTHFSTFEQMALSQGTTARMLMAFAMGGIVGWEREWRHKASGLRTNMLICMGAALFTMLSPVLAGEIGTNKGQVASNIVQGIGFLGAGLILHTRNRVLGLTSAATVWVVAAVGMACGAGLYVEAAIATLIVYFALRFIGLLESRSKWKRYPMLYEVRGSDESTMFTDILAVLDREHLRLNIVERDKLGELERVTFTVSASRARHQHLLAELNESRATDKVVLFSDEEEVEPAMIPFVKAHACGNDFLILEETLAGRAHADLARKLCSRNTSIGADGIEFLDRRANGDFFLRLFNADGSEAELSGNGTRCVAAWLAHSAGLHDVVLGTHGGNRTCHVIEARGAQYLIESDMGIPQVMPRTIELSGVGDVAGAMVNVGNPHFVLFVEREDFGAHGLSWQELGAKISTSPLFHHGTNVEFVQLRSADEIAFRIYERGCGPTTSSGTGTCASSAAAMALRGAARELTAIAEGGAQRTVWPANDAVMLLTGPAEILCQGEALQADPPMVGREAEVL